MKKYFLLFCVSILLSCSSGKSKTPDYFVVDYNSEKLCKGIQNLNEYIDKSKEIKNYFIGDKENTRLRIKIDTLITEGVPEIVSIKAGIEEKIRLKEKIPLEQAHRILELRSIRNPVIKLKSCIQDSNLINPQINLEYYYYSEYGLLIAEISKIKYKPEYGEGFLVLAELDSIGSIKIIKTSYWQE